MSVVDDDGTLITGTGRKIPALHTSAAMFLNQTTVLYGPSKTGKSVAVKHIMHELKDHIEQIIVVSPTEPANKSYEGFVDAPLIHYRLHLADPANPKKDDGTRGAVRFLDAVWSRQEMMVSIYRRANNPDVLAALFARLPKAISMGGLAHIRDINQRRETVIAQVRKKYALDVPRLETKVKEANDKFREMLVLIYKKYIAPQYAALWARTDLTPDERCSLTYLSFNPRLLLVLDDCAAQFKPLREKEIFRKFFYQNRHSFISLVICCQDDTDLGTNLRKNVFTSVFSEAVVCRSNFERTSNQFPKSTKALINEITDDVYHDRYRMLAYIREDAAQQHFYHIMFPQHRKFRFGSDAAHELCESVQSVGVAVDKENPYYEHFHTGAPA